MKRGTAQILSILAAVIVVILLLCAMPSQNEGFMTVVLLIYIPIGILLNYFQRCPHCGAWPRKGSLFHAYCPRCGQRLDE